MTDNHNPFEWAMAELLSIEGHYVDHKDDRGGPTSWGVTEKLARLYGYQDMMANLPLSLAWTIYRAEFWDHRRLQLEKLAEVSERVALEVFEQAVNTGVYGTAKRVQRVLNVLNRDEDLFLDLKVDAWLGRATRETVAKLIKVSDGEYLLQWLNVAQGAHYFALCEEDPTQEAFARGWIDKRVKV